MNKIYTLIYERARANGIEIEKNPKHKKSSDYIGAGRRNVKFSNSNKIYSYNMNLLELGLHLKLISQEEYNQYIISLGNLICGNCNSFVGIEYIKQIGKCCNCGKEITLTS
jgi:hypothetical protein